MSSHFDRGVLKINVSFRKISIYKAPLSKSKNSEMTAFAPLESLKIVPGGRAHRPTAVTGLILGWLGTLLGGLGPGCKRSEAGGVMPII